MSSCESVTADIKQILDAFDRIVSMYELEHWLKDITVEDIKSSFKLALFVEEAVKNLQIKHCEDLFFKNILNSYWKDKNRTKTYDIQFFSVACDHLLQKFFTNSSMKVSTLDVAVRMYTTMHARDRFETCISDLILNSASYAALLDYTIANKNELDLKDLECRLLLRNWSSEAECGRIDGVKSTVATMLSSYKIESSLPTLICILALENVSDQEAMIKSIILQDLLSKMVDRSILSKYFWLSLFRHVEKKYLGIVCVKFDGFLKELFNFIVYIGCMMNYEVHNFEGKWVGDPTTSICPEITYDDLVNLIKFLCNYSVDLRKYVESRISEAKNSTDSLLWQQLEKDH